MASWVPDCKISHNYSYSLIQVATITSLTKNLGLSAGLCARLLLFFWYLIVASHSPSHIPFHCLYWKCYFPVSSTTSSPFSFTCSSKMIPLVMQWFHTSVSTPPFLLTPGSFYQKHILDFSFQIPTYPNINPFNFFQNACSSWALASP